jgi:hypothetical protein
MQEHGVARVTRTRPVCGFAAEGLAAVVQARVAYIAERGRGHPLGTHPANAG